MTEVLVLIASGPEDAPARALEGLTQARAMFQIGMLDRVRVLLTGPGVGCIAESPEAEEHREAVEELLADGVEVAACTKSLNSADLLDTAAGLPLLRPVGTPTYLSERARSGDTVVSF